MPYEKNRLPYFDNAEDAQNYARENPGTVITRSNGGDGYVIASSGSITQPQAMKVSPQSILSYLNQHVISQESAKEEISLALYYHYIKYESRHKNAIHNNGPLMLVGSTGTGKTFIVQKACEAVGIPFIHVDTASMVPEGIVGYCMSDLMADILFKSGYDKSKAEHAVVFFDEVDKLFASDNASDYGKKISQQMLRMIEGDKVKLSSPKVSPDDEVFKELNTSNMQFIFGGAFQWLLDVRINEEPVMGFASSKKPNRKSYLSVEDLYASGVAKEFLGRVSTVVSLRPLSQNDIYEVLTNSQSSPLKKYMEKISMNGCKVKISDATYMNIAAEAANHPLGVRSIDFILKRLFKKALFESPLNKGATYVIEFH